VPDGTTPHMLSVDGAKVWYTEEAARSVGILDPGVAPGSASTISKSTSAIAEPYCEPLPAAATSAPTIATGTLSWTGSNWTVLRDSGGWTVFQMPAGIKPFGIALATDRTWVADQGRQKLARTSTAGLSAPALTITAAGANADLNWSAVSGAPQYEVWRGLSPYLAPNDGSSVLQSTETDTGWTDPGVLTNVDSHYYVVRAAGGGLTSAGSNRVGEFSFALVKGAN
jgi:streptogramin lyase